MNVVNLYNMDCRDVMSLFLHDNSVDAIVCDPPYGLAFMGKKWDYDVPGVDVWAECLRVLKPGGHLLAFAGTRTQHRMAVRIEDAGFEIRDMIAWVYGSGFPKSLDVSKAIDKAAGVAFDAVPASGVGFMNAEGARQWQGWGTALKPALEPITVARKPLVGTVATNVMEHGTGALNIDGCRVAFSGEADEAESKSKNQHAKFGSGPMTNQVYGKFNKDLEDYNPPGRWPANLIHDGSDEVLAGFPVTAPAKAGIRNAAKQGGTYGDFAGDDAPRLGHADSGGSAARFFYCTKAGKKDRGEGNNHPTVKPTDLMAYLCRLVTPPGGVVFDPFMGSGSTGKAALREGFGFIGCEMDAAYFAIAEARLAAVKAST